MNSQVRHRKTSLRTAMRERLLQLTDRDVRTRSEKICQRLATMPEFVNAGSLLAYVSTGYEVMTHALIRGLLANGRQVSVPYYHVVKRHYMAFQIVDFDADLSPGKFGILEPKPDAAHVTPIEKSDLVLVPGLAFDGDGHRLGRGMGFFDHILGGVRGVRIGLAYDCQVVTEVPVDAHDMHMDFIVTETELFDCRGTSST
jgi:5-formyltetrahydrofolate cyclo-ligase